MYDSLEVWAVNSFKIGHFWKIGSFLAGIGASFGGIVRIFTLFLIVSLYFEHQYRCVLMVY